MPLNTAKSTTQSTVVPAIPDQPQPIRPLSHMGEPSSTFPPQPGKEACRSHLLRFIRRHFLVYLTAFPSDTDLIHRCAKLRCKTIPVLDIFEININPHFPTIPHLLQYF